MFIEVHTDTDKEPIFINVNRISHILKDGDNVDHCLVFTAGDNDDYFKLSETYENVKSKIRYATGAVK